MNVRIDNTVHEQARMSNEGNSFTRCGERYYLTYTVWKKQQRAYDEDVRIPLARVVVEPVNCVGCLGWSP